MLEIEQLEREWRKYKIKRYRPVIFVVLLAVGAGVALTFLPEITEKSSKPAIVATPRTQPSNPVEPAKAPAAMPAVKQPTAPKTAPVVPSPKASPIVQKASEAQAAGPKVEAKPEKEVVLNPDTAFLSSFENGAASHGPAPVRHETIRSVSKKPVEKPRRETSKAMQRISKTQPAPQSRKNEPVATQKAATLQKEEEVAENTPSSGDEGGKLVISTKQTNNTLEYLIKRFNETRDPKLASYIAQSFFKKGNYKETIRWAIMANSIDPASEESWLLFAKAKVQIGQREDAIRALRIYLNQYTSKKIKSYLQTLESGL